MPFFRLSWFAFITFSLIFTGFGQKNGEKFVKDEVLVKFRAGAGSESIKNAKRSVGADSSESLGDLNWQRFKLPAGLTVEKAMKKLRAGEDVVDVQPNFYYSLLATPNDPQFPLSGMFGLTKISAPQAWDLATGSQSVVVANIDTGIRYTHEDLAAN